jgi:hypothetical protein
MAEKEIIKVEVTFTTFVKCKGELELDAAHAREHGYDPDDPGSLREYLAMADEIDDDGAFYWGDYVTETPDMEAIGEPPDLHSARRAP